MAMAMSKLVNVAVGAGLSLTAAGLLLMLYLRRKEEQEFESNFAAICKERTRSANQSIIRVKIPKHCLGAVIGRQGANVKEIQETTKTKIEFPNKDAIGDQCEVVIRGHADDIRVAEMKINETIKELLSIETCEMFIPSDACGRIIGRNGENIRYMCRISKAKINVDARNRCARTQRVTIRGSPEQIEYVKSLINEKLMELEREQTRNTSDPNKERKILSIGSPDDTQPYGLDDIQTEKLVSTSSDGFIEVYVSTVKSPHQFWVQVVQGGKCTELDKLIEEMTDYYDANPNSNVLQEVKVGDIVAAPFNHDNCWYRVRVEELEDDPYSPAERKVTLHYVDFGDVETLTMSQLRSLDRSCLRLPLQAIECRLGRVEPVADAWTSEAVQSFANLCKVAQWKTLMLRVFDNLHANVPHVQLIDTSGPINVVFVDELVKENHAKLVENQ
uniref:Tudor domain-containing protein n=1 Tax=Strigamia maritima TaxID=126957 RepID=T1J1N8_STRMM